jgi:ABC-type antimicrobial peptide transport system permease subunit
MLLENFKLAIKSMVTSKMRTFLSLLGIVIGVGSVVAIMTLGESVKTAINGEMELSGMDIVTVMNMGSNTIFDEDLGYDIKNNVVGIDSLSVQATGSAMVRHSQETTSATVYGVSSTYADLEKLEIMDGSFFTLEDNMERNQVVVLGYDVAMDLFPGGDALGNYVSVFRTQAKSYKVVGVLADTSESSTSDTNSNVYMPFYTYSQNIRKVNSISTYYFKVNENFSTTDVATDVKAYLSNVASSSEYNVSTAQEFVDMANSVMSYLTTFLSAIAAISLVVGGIGIMNIMLVTVVERTKEIGIRKALGATPKTIRHQFLVEATVLSVCGGVFGIFFGLIISYVVASALSYGMTISFMSIVLSLAFSCAVGIFFGSYPAAKAAALDPIQALSYE